MRLASRVRTTEMGRPCAKAGNNRGLALSDLYVGTHATPFDAVLAVIQETITNV